MIFCCFDFHFTIKHFILRVLRGPFVRKVCPQKMQNVPFDPIGFCFQGGACLIWVVVWWLYVSDTPAEHKYISKEEVAYIGQVSSPVSPPIPWRSILTSLPFWAIFVANFGNNWGFHLLLTELPIYMKTILRRDINSNALLSSLPYLCMWGFSLVISSLADKAITAKWLKTGIVRRIATAIAHRKVTKCAKMGLGNCVHPIIFTGGPR